MSKSARALVLEQPRTLVPREFPVPETGDEDALLRVEACGLCGTDHEQYTGHLPAGFAFVPGHETVGVIDRIGDAAAQRWSVAAGDRVAVEVFQSCRACKACEAGAYQRCERHGLADMYGYIPVDKPPGLWGGYAQYQYLGPDAIMHPVPDAIDPVVATLFNPLGAGVRWGVTVPGTKRGDVVAVLGPGVRGLSVLAAVREAGAGFVMVTGRGARDAERLGVARDFGADLVVDTADMDPTRALRDATGGLADVVVDVTAKAPEAFAQAVALARPAGTVVVAGTRGSPAPPDFWPDHIVFKELRIVGALGVDSDAYRAALAMLAADRYPFAALPRRVAGLDDAEALIQSLAGEGDVPPPVHGVIVP
ncbi:MAG TPA: zinc-binding dehydrogenase [Acidimicrobiia bacterium]|nr:zinc-binding dehydrogenase [Acidimicrobiia bacterium]